MNPPPTTDLWQLNPRLRLFPAANGSCLIELDDRHGRALRLSVASETAALLECFRHARSWSLLRQELSSSGIAQERIAAIGEFLSGPCRERRILVAPGDAPLAEDRPFKPAYLNLMVELLSPRLVNPVSRLLQHLFAPGALAAGLAAVVLGMAAMFSAMRDPRLELTLAAGDVLRVGLLSAFGIFLHELGHAAAAYRLGARRVAIGIGWYLVMPVAYSDLSELWRFERRQRVVVDLAGVYMQGLLLTAMVLLFLRGGDVAWLVAAGATATSMLWNLNPFLRMDGYWVVADALDMHDLRHRAAAELASVVRALTGRRAPATPEVSWQLLLYASASAIFLGWLLYRAVLFLWQTAEQTLPAAWTQFVRGDWQAWGAAQWVLAVLAVAWHALLIVMMLRMIGTTPERLLRWWRGERSA